VEVPLTVLAVFDAHAAESEPKTVSPCPAKVTVGPRAGLWLVNIHRAPDGNLLGAIHVELHSGEPAANHGEEYALGLVFSQDGGERWVYCGEIVRPQDAHGNVGGAPLLVVGDYFHVSFNDQGPSGRRAAVARAPVADVLQAARCGLVTPWRKFSDGDWTQDGLTGYGAAVLAQPDLGEGHPIDLHADAAWNRALARYMVTSWCAGGGVGRLYLHLSDDAIHFEPPILVDEEPGQWMPYSTFLTDERDHEIDDMNGPDFFLGERCKESLEERAGVHEESRTIRGPVAICLAAVHGPHSFAEKCRTHGGRVSLGFLWASLFQGEARRIASGLPGLTPR